MALKKADNDALRWAIEKYWREKTDDELATGLGVRVEEVVKMREEMGYQRNKKGKESLKEFARRYLMEMSEEDKSEFMSRLPPELVWRMAEGSPATSGTLDLGIEPVKIDITHHLLKAYGEDATRTLGRGTVKVLEHGESVRLPG